MNYYNEFNPKAAQWLRELIKAGEIPKGEVDERDMQEIKGSELDGFTSCHFFAGIGGWPYALRLAGWPDEKSVWTGSCPCQPFSVAGRGLGEDDERHLWPTFANLIKEQNPSIVFGEQVAGSGGLKWLAGVFADLERMGRTRVGADLCAAGVSSPQIRQRLYWMAYADNARSQGRIGRELQKCREEWTTLPSSPFCDGVGNSERDRRHNGRRIDGGCVEKSTRNEEAIRSELLVKTSGSSFTHWNNFDIVPCEEGKWRRIESGTFPLANGIPNRMELLRGYGNAIVPQIAATFILSCMEAIEEVLK